MSGGVYYKYASSDLIVLLKGSVGRKSPASANSYHWIRVGNPGHRQAYFELALYRDRLL